jgi:uncharacterized membrane protein
MLSTPRPSASRAQRTAVPVEPSQAKMTDTPRNRLVHGLVMGAIACIVVSTTPGVALVPAGLIAGVVMAIVGPIMFFALLPRFARRFGRNGRW